LAYHVYQTTFGMIANKLEGTKRLSVVTNGALTLSSVPGGGTQPAIQRVREDQQARGLASDKTGKGDIEVAFVGRVNKIDLPLGPLRSHGCARSPSAALARAGDRLQERLKG
jgi:hypothetical protein